MALSTKALVTSLMNLTKMKRKSSTWYEFSDFSIGVVNLQRSQWGPQYYLNVGVLIREIEDLPFPKESQCHLRCRVESLYPTFRGVVLDDTTKIDAAERGEVLRTAIFDHIRPHLLACQTIEGLRAVLSHEKLRLQAVLKLIEFMQNHS